VPVPRAEYLELIARHGSGGHPLPAGALPARRLAEPVPVEGLAA